MKRRTITSLVLVALVTTAVVGVSAEQAKEKAAKDAQPSEAAVKRTRRTVKMLDDIYKQTIVLITDKYVHSDEDYPAGSAAVALFKTISDNGWHNVRLLDATGSPYDPDNVAKDEFEKRGIEQLKQGQEYVEQIVEKDGQHHLRAITPVPVVMDKCIMCHGHYEDAEEGEPIGAISYSVLID